MHARQLLPLVLLSLAPALPGCAGIKVYEVGSDGRPAKETGFLYYDPKVYLVIETGKEGKSAKLLSVPDLSQPRLIRHERGFGSASFSFNVQNGLLGSVNSAADAKVPETVTGVAAMVTAVPGLGAMVWTEGDFKIGPLVDAGKALDEQVAARLVNAPNADVKNYGEEVKKLADSIKGAGSVDLKVGDDLVKVLAERQAAVAKLLPSLSSLRLALTNLHAGLKPGDPAHDALIDPLFQLESILKRLTAWTAGSDQIAMWEIVRDGPRSIRFEPIVLPTR